MFANIIFKEFSNSSNTIVLLSLCIDLGNCVIEQNCQGAFREISEHTGVQSQFFTANPCVDVLYSYISIL